MRHAKSSWDDASLSDFERPLNSRGERAAPFMGKLMREKGFAPSVVTSSPAERAKQTARAVMGAADLTCELRFDDRIYEASPRTLLQVVSGIDDVHPSAMLVGHNPGIEGFIRLLTDRVEPMATASFAVIDLKIDVWNKTADGCGSIRDILRPRDLISNPAS